MHEKPERIYGADLVRFISCLGIIFAHFSCDSRVKWYLLRSPNGDLVYCFVTVFLILSGAMLYYNHQNKLSLKAFYYKRWKSVYPVFYIIYLFFFFLRVLSSGRLLYRSPGVEPWRLIYSLLGIDGYLNYGGLEISTWYLVGDWFLGVIIILYALYPLVQKLMRKIPFLLPGVLFVVLIITLLQDIPDSNKQRSIFTCLFCFCLGMLYIRYRKFFFNYISAVVSSILVLVVKFVHIPINHIFIRIFAGMCLFTALMFWGEKIMKSPLLRKIVVPLSNLALPVFLIQHTFITTVIFPAFNPVYKGKAIILLLVTAILIFIFAKAADILAKAVLATKPMKALERKFLN